MGSLKRVVPPRPTLPSSFQHAKLPSDVGHVGHEQQGNHPRADGVLRTQSNRPATPMAKHLSKVNGLGKQGPLQEARKSRREPTRNFLTIFFSGLFKRRRNLEIDQLRRENDELRIRCANLEEGNYSVYGSCRPSTLDIPQSLQKPDVEISQSILSLSEDSKSQRTTTNMVAQANVTPLEANDQASPARQGLVLQEPAGAEGHPEAKDVDPAIQSIMPPRTADDGPSSTPLDLNQSAVTPATQDATVPKLPRKKKEDEELDTEVMVEEEAQSGYIDRERHPRKKQRSEELEVDTLPPHDQERLPRKKEGDGGRSG